MKLVKLEFIRSVASLYVFILHFVLLYIQELSDFAIKFFLFGPEAVTAFFLLSGFVIKYSYVKKREDFHIYFIKRFRRIYPLFIIGFILSIICMYLSYEDVSIPIKMIVGHLFMLQNAAHEFQGVFVGCIQNNPPFWSLSHEWWYYMLFVPTFLIGQKLRISSHLLSVGVSLIATIGYYLEPNFVCLILMYYVLWYTGAEMANIYIRDGKLTLSNTYIIVLSLFIIIAVHILFLYPASVNSGHISFMKSPFLLIRYPLAALVFVLSSLYLNRLFSIFMKYIPENLIVKTAAISYGIYIFHYPIILLPNYSGITLVDIAWKTALVFGLAYVGEIILQPYFFKLFPAPKPKPVQ